MTASVSIRTRVTQVFSFASSHHRLRWAEVMEEMHYVATPFRLDDDVGYASDIETQTLEDGNDESDVAAALLQHR